jgi:REP element-mobilizing transposase RayT
MKRNPQQNLFKGNAKQYGGSLLKTRKGRLHGRPISTQYSMHFVLRSSQAKGPWSLGRHREKIKSILEKFAAKNGVILKSSANVGNHLHIHLQLTSRHAYRAFIRAVTSAIMMAVTGVSRWSRTKLERKFWDLRPFSRIVIGFRATLALKDYIAINQLEGYGVHRANARFIIEWDRGKAASFASN